MFFTIGWSAFVLQLYAKRASCAIPLRIVTMKAVAELTPSRPAIVVMVPDKEPLIHGRRQQATPHPQYDFTQINEKPEEFPNQYNYTGYYYDKSYHKYYDSDYQDDGNVGFQFHDHRYPPGHTMFAPGVAMKQIPHVFQGIFFPTKVTIRLSSINIGKFYTKSVPLELFPYQRGGREKVMLDVGKNTRSEATKFTKHRNRVNYKTSTSRVRLQKHRPHLQHHTDERKYPKEERTNHRLKHQSIHLNYANSDERSVKYSSDETDSQNFIKLKLPKFQKQYNRRRVKTIDRVKDSWLQKLTPQAQYHTAGVTKKTLPQGSEYDVITERMMILHQKNQRPLEYRMPLEHYRPQSRQKPSEYETIKKYQKPLKNQRLLKLFRGLIDLLPSSLEESKADQFEGKRRRKEIRRKHS